MAGPACAPKGAGADGRNVAKFVSTDISNRGLTRLAYSMDPSMRALAIRHDPGVRRADLWSRPEGWERLDLTNVPNLGFTGDAEGETAEELNALRSFSKLPIRPMKPFYLAPSSPEYGRALECLSQAVYYEAAREPQLGQEGVAQVVLNRMRHPAYPKSVCGVVYQGAARTTGCQFTFTCDGSLRWAPQPALWSRARAVAARALAGYVDKTVGSATHYHAQYVAPYWAPTLVKMTQVGQHIFAGPAHGASRRRSPAAMPGARPICRRRCWARWTSGPRAACCHPRRRGYRPNARSRWPWPARCAPTTSSIPPPRAARRPG